ncbi:MAG: cardiolipin synthase [Spongiibacteraceae bacterium]
MHGDFLNSASVWVSSHYASITTALAAIIVLLSIFSALEAILKSRTAQGAAAWAIVLIVIPPLSLPLYWIFGRRKFRGYAKAQRSDNPEISSLAAALQQQHREFSSRQSNSDPRLHALEKLSALPFSSSNSSELLIDGDDAFDYIFNKIEQAKHYVLLEFYIVRDDAIGQELAELLTRKAQQGLAIYFIYDEIGSFQLPSSYIRRLEQAGVNIQAFNSTKGFGNRLQLNFRNHRKIVVTDGIDCIIGGMNIGDEYRHFDPKLTPWRDTGIALSGPVVQSAQLAFCEDWYWATESLPKLNWQLQASADQNRSAMLIATGPADVVESCALVFLNLIQQAKERLWIVSPYFVPDTPIIQALQLAAMRGVDVRILLPETPDKLMIKLSSYTAIKETISQGVQIYFYKKGFLHQKALLVDNDIGAIGTANLDNRSFRLNFEIMAICHDRTFTSELENMLNTDFQHSYQLRPRDVAEWSLGRRLISRCAYLFAPIL